MKRMQDSDVMEEGDKKKSEKKKRDGRKVTLD